VSNHQKKVPKKSVILAFWKRLAITGLRSNNSYVAREVISERKVARGQQKVKHHCAICIHKLCTSLCCTHLYIHSMAIHFRNFDVCYWLQSLHSVLFSWLDFFLQIHIMDCGYEYNGIDCHVVADIKWCCRLMSKMT